MAQPDFTPEELALLLDYHLDLQAGSEPSIEKLSQTLRSLDLHADRGDPQVFRNVDGIRRAARRFGAYDGSAPDDRDTPAYRKVWDRYAGDPGGLKAEVARIIATHASGGIPVQREPAVGNAWWLQDPAERFWLEATHRPDIGADLHAPQANKDGKPFWSYELVREVKAGDVVFHYDADQQSIASWSLATGDEWVADAWWSALGTASRDVAPSLQPHWFAGLHGPFPLDTWVTRGDLQDHEGRIAEVKAGYEDRFGKPIYSPFQLRSDGLRIAQGYLFKLPASLLPAFPSLQAAGELAEQLPVEIRTRRRSPGGTSGQGSEADAGGTIGEPYVAADESATIAEADPFPVDPSVVERGLQSHAKLQNALAGQVGRRGLEPLKPGPHDPLFDLAWEEDGVLWVAEVKSLTPANQERQLRLGLGQVLRYRQQLETPERPVKAMLFVESRPAGGWDQVCASAHVQLAWPEAADG